MANNYGRASHEHELLKKELNAEIRKLTLELSNANFLLNQYEDNLQLLAREAETIEKDLMQKINQQNQ